jgi:hypothetical protein
MFHIQLTIVDTKNNTTLADVRASCIERTNIKRTLNTMLKTEPVLSVHNGSSHAPISLPTDTTVTAKDVRARAAAKLTTTKTIIDLARRNQTYVEPLPHMDEGVLNAHTNLLAFLNTLPPEIPGVATIRVAAHRQWFAYYDRNISAGVLRDWIAQQHLTVRGWQADHLMAQLQAYDFQGRTHRLRVQQHRAALLHKRMSPEAFDKHMITASEFLRKLQAL